MIRTLRNLTVATSLVGALTVPMMQAAAGAQTVGCAKGRGSVVMQGKTRDDVTEKCVKKDLDLRSYTAKSKKGTAKPVFMFSLNGAKSGAIRIQKQYADGKLGKEEVVYLSAAKKVTDWSADLDQNEYVVLGISASIR
jgi:hypothetical protein